MSLLDRPGTMVARHPDPDRWVGRSLPDAQIIRTVLAQGEGTVDLPDLDGVTRLFAFKPLIGAGPQSSRDCCRHRQGHGVCGRRLDLDQEA